MNAGQPDRLPRSAAGTAPFRRILFIVVALIAYGSLYPWHFRKVNLYASPLWILWHSWPSVFNRFIAWDVAVNMTLYLPLGIFAYLAVNATASRLARFLLPLALALALSASIEMLQLCDVSRECSASDVASDVAGAAVGIAAGALYRRRLQLWLEGEEALLRPSGALLLLSCWLGYQLFPLFPSWGRTRLLAKIAALGPVAAISPLETVMVLAEWLAVACLVESLLNGKSRNRLALLLLVLPARLLIASRTVAWPDIAGALAACAVWLCLPRLYIRRGAPVLLAAAIILGELAPFHLQGAGSFNWVPFRGSFQSSWQTGLVVLFRKSFGYGSVLWLWRAAGGRLAIATAAGAAALFILEQVQVRLPGRTPEITDAVLAVLMAVLLWLLRNA